MLPALSGVADYLGGQQQWTGAWKEIQTGLYTVKINYAGEMAFTVNGVSFGFGQFQGRWRNKTFAMHSDLHGKGPWTTVGGRVEPEPDGGTRITVKGTIADMSICQTLTAGSNSLYYLWRGEVTDPSPEIDRAGFEGAVDIRTRPDLDPACSVWPADGRPVKFRLRDDFGTLENLEQFEFDVDGQPVRIVFCDVRRLTFRQNKERPDIPIRFNFTAGGASHLAPGAVSSYSIEVRIGPARTKPGGTAIKAGQ